MAVYIDDLAVLLRGRRMCHMAADSLEELHAMAEKVGIGREWFHDGDTPINKRLRLHSHYDVNLRESKLVIEQGAIVVQAADMVYRLVWGHFPNKGSVLLSWEGSKLARSKKP